MPFNKRMQRTPGASLAGAADSKNPLNGPIAMKLPEERIYSKAFEDRTDVILWEVVPVRDGELLTLTFESVSSSWRQGVWVMTEGLLSIADEESKSFILWSDTAPPEVPIKCLKTKGRLHVYNIWDSGRGYGKESQSHTSGMLVQDLPTGWRFHCNDIGFDADFKKLVFRLERVS